MKKNVLIVVLCALLFAGCGGKTPPAQVAATTLPVYEFTSQLCSGTPITVTRLVTEQVSCLHDYSLSVRQVKAVEAAQVVVRSGAGLEDFMEDLLIGKQVIDASQGIALLHSEEEDPHDHDHEGHHHGDDPHFWLAPANAAVMVQNIRDGLCQLYPNYRSVISANCEDLIAQLDALEQYGRSQLSNLSCRELITFHDGFHYFADAFDLTILEAVEEEAGSEASAKMLIHLVDTVREHRLPAVFTERSGSSSAAAILARETGCQVFTLDMAMAADSYFDAMFHNIDTVKEALQ